jgi:hypothetical protein
MGATKPIKNAFLASRNKNEGFLGRLVQLGNCERIWNNQVCLAHRGEQVLEPFIVLPSCSQTCKQWVVSDQRTGSDKHLISVECGGYEPLSNWGDNSLLPPIIGAQCEQIYGEALIFGEVSF